MTGKRYDKYVVQGITPEMKNIFLPGAQWSLSLRG